MANAHPVILCHGLFGWGPSESGGFPYWGTAMSVPSPLDRHPASVGPISSTHDRLDQWGISAQLGDPLDVQLQRIAQSPMFRGTDNGAYSLTIQGLLEQNALCQTYPETYYFSSVTDQTFRGILSGHYYPEPGMNPFAIPTSLYIGHTTFQRPFYPGFRSEDWWENDGLVSVYSQMFPRIAGAHPVGGEIGSQTRFEPGKWYHEILSDVDHIDIVALPELGQVGFQRRFYTDLFKRLAAL